MSLLNIPIPNLLNGVSQQPANLRFPTQCEVQENGYSSIVEGLGKRPPTEHVAKLINGSVGTVRVHTIDRGDGVERYVVIIGDGIIKVFDMTTGAEKTVATPDGVGYLTGVTSAVSAFRAVSVADYTFILNTEKTVELDATLTTAAVNEALVWVKQGAYSTKYSISGTFSSSYSVGKTVLATAATVDGETFPIDSSPADTNFIAAQLKAALTGGTAPTFTRSGYTIRINQTAAFNMTVADGIGGVGLGLVKGSVQTFSDLPSVASNGMIVKVEGLPGESVDDYWVKFVSKNGSSMGEGTWAETIAPGTKFKYNYTTMPHVLIRLPSGSATDFVFKKADGVLHSSIAGTDAKWTDRVVGDDISNPAPTFVGNKIVDMFMFRGRLGFLSGENVIMSEAGQFFNFWRTSVTKLLDSDPIDIASSYPSITLFRHAVPFSERLVLFSDRVQFVLGTTQGVLTAANVSLTPVSNYDIMKGCGPVVLGEQIFFAFDRGGYSGVRELIANENDSTLLTAPDVSSHVPKYIPGKLIQLAGSTHDNILVGLADGDQGSLYVYKWYDATNERVQSSWSKWTITGGTVRGVSWIQSTLFVVVQRTEGLFLEKITVEPNRRDTYSQFVTTLDRRVGLTIGAGAYNSTTDKTTITIPYNIQTNVNMSVVLQATSTVEAGYIVDIDTATPGGTTIVLNGNWASKAVWVGEQYTLKYRFSTPYLRQGEGGRGVSLSSGRFQVRGMLLIYNNSSFFKTVVTHAFTGTSYNYTWSGNILGTGQAVIGGVPVESGSFRFPVYGKNDEMIMEIQNDTHLPSYFQSAEVEATFNARSQRV